MLQSRQNLNLSIIPNRTSATRLSFLKSDQTLGEDRSIESKKSSRNSRVELARPSIAFTKEVSGMKIDSATSLFAQHYSILRELRNYCVKFRDELLSRNDLEAVWRNLELLMGILDAGCHFLKFPLINNEEEQ